MNIVAKTLVMNDLSEAACAGADPELFFSYDLLHIREAKAYCRVCPLVEACLQEAIDNQEIGIWGGTTFEDRAALKRKQSMMARAAEREAKKRETKVEPSRAPNNQRTDEASKRDEPVYRKVLELHGNVIPEMMAQILKIRVENPELSIAQVGMLTNPRTSKDKVAGILRRAKLLV